MILTEILQRFKFWRNADRIGPDIPLTHWRLHFKSTMLKLCKRKFHYFSNTADFRPGAYAIGCRQISIGDRVVIRPATQLHAASLQPGINIVIENDVLIGSGVHIYTGNHKFSERGKNIIDQGHELSKPVTLEEGCWIGANAIILAGVTVGKNSVVGAGAVVTKSVPQRAVAAGNPARIIRQLD